MSLADRLADKVDPRQAARFLHRGYELERAGWRLVSALAVGRQLGLKEGSSRKICTYLVEQGFIEGLSELCGYCRNLAEAGLIDRYDSCGFRLSSRGVDEIEWGFSHSSFVHDVICEEAETP